VAIPAERGGHRTILTAVVSLALALAAAPATARPEDADEARPSTARVRALDARSAALLETGARRSPAIQQLVEELEQSDVIVYVETGLLGFSGRTLFVGASAEARFLRITLDVPEMDDRLLAWLGHELQHAAEIARAPDVRSAEAVRQLYLSVGHGVSGDGVCTPEAQRMTSQVAIELALENSPD
jgi:hypothetical protein